MAESLARALLSEPTLAAVFSDAALLAALLRFEAALARAEADAGVIPASAAAVIERVCTEPGFDAHALTLEARASATHGVAVVRALTTAVRAVDEQAAGFVHWGATSQDLVDTALALQIKQAGTVLAAALTGLAQAAIALAEAHPGTIALGRTLLQPAAPILLAQKFAGWALALAEARREFKASLGQAVILQFGGAVGNLAVLGGNAEQVARRLAEHLHLSWPGYARHALRGPMARLGGACALAGGTVAKIARDITLAMQFEVGELSEPALPGRGGSSALPHKRNPAACVLVLAAAQRLPALAATLYAALPQEHERGVGGWQVELPTLVDSLETLGSAVFALTPVLRGLIVHDAALAQNLARTHGLAQSEMLTAALAARIGKVRAQAWMERLVARVHAEHITLIEAADQDAELTQLLGTAEITTALRPENALGASTAMIRRMLERTRALLAD
ncbi:MAG: lyase family protein [Gammaproteobacteria bacterium]